MALPVYATLAGLGLLLAATAMLANRLRLPTALGYLLVGLAVAPIKLRTDLLPPAIANDASALAIVLIVFFIGLELELPKLQAILRRTAAPTVLELAAVAAAVTGLLVAVHWPMRQALAAGLCACVSSTIFGDRLTAGRTFPAVARERVLGVLLSEDIGSVLLLALMLVLGGQQASASSVALGIGTVVFLLIVLAGVVILIVPRAVDAAARTHVHEVVVLTSVGCLLSCAYAGWLIGSPELGAFLAGVAAAEAGSRHVVRNALATLRELSVAVFLFLSAALVDLHSARLETLWLGAAIAAVVLVGKLLVNGGASLVAREGFGNAVRVGFGLATLGEFSLVLVAAAEEHGVAHPELRNSIVAAVAILLVAASLGTNLTSRLPARDAHTMPARRDAPVAASVRPRTRRGPSIVPGLRLIASNMLLLVAWVVVTLVVAAPAVEARAQSIAPAATVAALALGAGVFGYGVFRGYRLIVLASLRIAVTTPAGRARLHTIDAWVAGGCAALLVPLALLFPASWPAAAIGLLVAAAVAAAAWRSLRRVHDALQESMERVLGRNVQPRFLQDAVQRHSLAVKVAAVPVPAGSPLAGSTLGASRLRELTGVTVAVLQRGGRDVVAPGAATQIQAGDVLVLYGDDAQLRRADALVVSHGDAIRLAAQSRTVDTVEVVVPDGSPWIGTPLGSLSIRRRSGALVLGVRRAGMPRAMPYSSAFVLQPGDRLILLGAHEQLALARTELDAHGDAPIRAWRGADGPEPDVGFDQTIPATRNPPPAPRTLPPDAKTRLYEGRGYTYE